jgi:hypothetical protein
MTRVALRVVSRPRSISVASGAKRTLSRIFDLDSAISLSLDLGARGVDRGGEYRERGAGPFASACHTRRPMESAVDDRRRLVSNKLQSATLAHPDREMAIVNVHDRAGLRDLGRHPFGHQRGAIALAAPSSAESITATPLGREGEVPSCRGGRRPGCVAIGTGG